ncbi:MAG: type II toxin-antitoxin system RelE/ParE family toxin [Candidatus Vogelbacteria bacterium]|nr:type II toxin-antitoxin system RelE/ParE family toxin [Candidatus Vogelbacteria bacterium]
MNWVSKFAREAEKQFRRLTRDRQEQFSKIIDGLVKNPLVGDIRLVKSGAFKGAWRRRVGNYRIFFALEEAKKLINILSIRKRDEKTYR